MLSLHLHARLMRQHHSTASNINMQCITALALPAICTFDCMLGDAGIGGLAGLGGLGGMEGLAGESSA